MQTKPRRITYFTNTLLGVLSWLTPIAIGFVATPLIVKNLGNRDFGIYASVLGFISYSFTFGIGKVLVKYISEFRSTGETDKISSAVSATFWFSIVIALVGTSVVALSAHSIVSRVMFLPEDQQATAQTALYLACGAIIVTMISQVFQYILQGLHQFGSFLLLTNISGVLLNIGNIGLAVSGYGITALLLWNLFALTAMAVCFAIFAKTRLSEFSIDPRRSLQMAPAVLRYGSNIILYQLFGNILFVFERAWIIRKFGSEAATFYLVPMTLAIYLHGIVGSALQAMFPIMNEILSDRSRLIELYKKSTKLALAIVVLAVVTVFVSGNWLLTVWLDRKMADNATILLFIHVITFSATVCLMNAWALSEGFRAPGLNTFVTLVWLLLSVPLMVFLADPYGNAGIAFARLIGVGTTIPMIFYAEHRFLGGVQWTFWRAIAWRLLLAGSLCFAVQLVIRDQFSDAGWAAVFALSFAGALVYGLVLLFNGYVTREERSFFLNFALRRG